MGTGAGLLRFVQASSDPAILLLKRALAVWELATKAKTRLARHAPQAIWGGARGLKYYVQGFLLTKPKNILASNQHFASIK